MDEQVKTWQDEDVRATPAAGQTQNVMQDPSDVQRVVSESLDFWETQQEIMREDERMYAGDQWTTEDEAERSEDNRPAPVLNMLGLYADYLHGGINDQRLSVRVVERDLPGYDTSGSARPDFVSMNSELKFDLANLLGAHLSHILEESDFPQQRSDATLKLLTTGMAFLRLSLDYDAGDPANLTFQLKSVNDQMEVLFDPSFTEPDASDAGWCAVNTHVDIDVAQARWPGVNLEHLRLGSAAQMFGFLRRDKFWVDKENRVRVMEFFQVVEEKEMRVILSDGSDMREAHFKEVADELVEREVYPVAAREFCYNRVYLSRWVGDQRISGPTLLPYDRLPVFPLFGRRKIYRDRPVYYSVIHEATDIQRMVNYVSAQVIQQASRSGNSPWVAAPAAVAGHEGYGDPMNQDNVLFYNPFDDQRRQLPAPQRQRPLNADPVLRDALVFFSGQLSDVVGLDEAGLGRASNAVSARSSEVRIQAQQQNFATYTLALTNAVERACEAIIAAIPKVYDDERYIRVKLPDGTLDWVRINSDFITTEEGEKVAKNGVRTQRAMKVRVQAIASDETKKQMELRVLTELLKLSPNSAPVVADKIARFMDSSLADEIGNRLISQLPLSALSPEERQARVESEISAATTAEELKFRIATEVTQPAQMLREQMGLPPDEPPMEVQIEQAKLETERARTQTQMAMAKGQVDVRDSKVGAIMAESERGAAKDQATLMGKELDNRKKMEEAGATSREAIQDMVNEAVVKAVQRLGLAANTGANEDV